jgi:hypothetical protein
MASPTVIIQGEALECLLDRLKRRQMANMEITKISVDVRESPDHPGVAVKVNEGMWSPTLKSD